jgi:glycosyltransferase involved in cell wall biosynthesis
MGVAVDERKCAAPDPTAPSLTLVIPAYNEATRLGETLEAASAYLGGQAYEHELIVVDDGSTDETAAIAAAFAGGQRNVRLLSIPHGGKAAAVRAGMDAASMDLIAFCDADLATPLTHLPEFRVAAANGCAVVIGSREGAGSRRIGEPIYRHLMGRVFNTLVRVLLLPGIQDTQCGFKLFGREAADSILRRARLYSGSSEVVAGPRVTAFDVELLVVARRLGYEVCSIPVVWTYGKQSKVNPARDTWYNLLDVLRVRVNAWRGRYDRP